MPQKLIAVLISIVLLISMVACSGTNGTTGGSNDAIGDSNDAIGDSNDTAAEVNDDPGKPSGSTGAVLSPENPVTITVWITSDETAPSEDNKISKLLKDELGVTLEYEIITPENADMRIKTLLVSGEYPDLLGTSDTKFGLVIGGAFIRLNEYLDSGNYPLLKEHVDPYIDYLSYRGGEVPEGLYVLPNYNRYYGEITGGTHSGSGFWIQKAVLEDAGYPDLSNMTIEKMFELIENYKNKYPTIDGMPTIGFSIPTAAGHTWGLTNPPSLLAGSPNNGDVIVDQNDVATIYADSDYAYRWFKFLNEMNAKKLIDTESFTQTDDQYKSKLASGNVLLMHDQYWAFSTSYDLLHAAGKDERTWIALMPTFDSLKPWYADRDVMNTQQGYGVSVSCKQVDAVLAFLETMMTEKWQKILFWGIEGEDYSVGSDGLFVRSGQQRAEQDDPAWRESNRLMAFRNQLPKRQGTWPDGNAFDPGGSKVEFFESLSDYDKNFLNNYGKQTWKEFVNQPPDNPLYYPCWNIQKDAAADAVSAQMQSTSMEYLPKAIMTSTADFDTVWNEYITALHTLDIKSYLDCINAGIQERIELFGGQ